MGINLWDETFYEKNKIYYEICRTKYPKTIKEKDVNEILK